MRLQFHEKKHAYYVEKTIRLNFLPRYNIAFIAYTLYSLENRRISSVLYLSLLPSCLIQLELTFPKWFLCFGLLQHLLCFTDVELQAKDDFFWSQRWHIFIIHHFWNSRLFCLNTHWKRAEISKLVDEETV